MKLMLTGLAGAAEAACGARSAPSDSGTTAAIAIMRSLLICPPGSGFAPGRLTSSRLLTVMERNIRRPAAACAQHGSPLHFSTLGYTLNPILLICQSRRERHGNP